MEKRGWKLLTIPPVAVKSYRENVLRVTRPMRPTHLLWHVFESGDRFKASVQPRRLLRKLTRWRESLVNDKTRTINRLRQTVAAYWPELTQEKLIEDYEDVYATALFEFHPDPVELAQLDFAALRKFFRQHGSSIRNQKLLRLQRLAQLNSVTASEKPLLLKTTRLLAKRLRELVADIAAVDQLIEEAIEFDPAVQELLKWKGAGQTLVSTLVAEIQHVSNFSSEAKLASYAGVALRKVQTGKSTKYKKPQRRANRRLKRVIKQLAHSRFVHDPESRRFYDKKRSEGKALSVSRRPNGYMRVAWRPGKSRRGRSRPPRPGFAPGYSRKRNSTEWRESRLR